MLQTFASFQGRSHHHPTQVTNRLDAGTNRNSQRKYTHPARSSNNSLQCFSVLFDTSLDKEVQSCKETRPKDGIEFSSARLLGRAGLGSRALLILGAGMCVQPPRSWGVGQREARHTWGQWSLSVPVFLRPKVVLWAGQVRLLLPVLVPGISLKAFTCRLAEGEVTPIQTLPRQVGLCTLRMGCLPPAPALELSHLAPVPSHSRWERPAAPALPRDAVCTLACSSLATQAPRSLPPVCEAPTLWVVPVRENQAAPSSCEMRCLEAK